MGTGEMGTGEMGTGEMGTKAGSQVVRGWNREGLKTTKRNPCGSIYLNTVVESPRRTHVRRMSGSETAAHKQRQPVRVQQQASIGSSFHISEGAAEASDSD
jgi:hypothetical protein